MAPVSWAAAALSAAFALLACSSTAYEHGPRASYNAALSTMSSQSGAASTYLAGLKGHPSIPLASASSIASVAAAQQSQSSIVPPIPLPTNVSKYEKLLQIVPGLPPLPGMPSRPAFEDAHAEPTRERLNPRTDRHPARDFSHVASLNLSSLDSLPRPLRVMVVGDSMSQGQQGDWTWRYRIWSWFVNNGIEVEMVGPYVGTAAPQDPTPPVPPLPFGQSHTQSNGSFTGGYAVGVDPSWGGRHFSAWGKPAAIAQSQIAGVLQENPADLILLMLGFNDLGWFYSDASGTLQSVYNLVTNAVAVNPNIAIAIANIPQRSSLGRIDLPANTDLYNQLLSEDLPNWQADFPSAKLGVVLLEQNYNCQPAACPVGYDGLHPNALGEYEIAQAFSQTLHSTFGLGNGPLAIPGVIPPRPLPVPSNFKVFTSPQGVTASWDAVYGAYSYEITSENVNIGISATGSVPANVWYQQWSLPGDTYTVQVRAAAGDQYGDWTSVESAIAKPQTAAAPNNINVQPTADGITVTWDPPTGPYTDSIVIYSVLLWDQTAPCNFVYANGFHSSPAVIPNLNVGDNYFVAVETWNANGEGFPEVVNDAIPGAGTPATPGGLDIIATNPTSVYFTWDDVTDAAGYRVWVKGINDAANYTEANSTTTINCSEDFFMFPGTWNYEFAISAYNGNKESPMSPFKAAPSPVGSVSMTCPSPPAWCSGGGGPWGPQPEPNPGKGNLPGEGGAGSSPGGSASVITVTETINGHVTTIVETLVYLTTTDGRGQPSAYVSIEGPTTTGPLPPGASLVTFTSTGAGGQQTIVVETVYPTVTINAQGSRVTGVATIGPVFPGGGVGTAPGGSSGGNGGASGVGVTGHSTAKSTTKSTTPVTTTTPALTNSNGYTLVPTTATYNGHTYTGTITESPGQAGTSSAYHTFSYFPSGLSTSAVHVASNTVIVVQGTGVSDPHGNHPGNQLNPVFGPWPGCWFCPPGSSGIEVLGFKNRFEIDQGAIFPAGGNLPGFPEPLPKITIGGNGIPTYGPPPDTKPTSPTNPSQSTKPSSCTSSAVPRCTETVLLTTAVLGSSTTVMSSTSISCETVTACNGRPTTMTTTSATTATTEPISFYCISTPSPVAKRTSPTPHSIPVPDECHECGRTRRKPFQSSLAVANFTLSERAIPGPGTGDWGAFYQNLDDMPITKYFDTVTIANHLFGTSTSAETFNFGDGDFNVLAEGSYGCTTVLITSRLGVTFFHFWEIPGMYKVTQYDSEGEPQNVVADAANFRTQVTDVVQRVMEPLVGSPTSMYAPSANPHIYIFTGSSMLVHTYDPSTLVSGRYPLPDLSVPMLQSIRNQFLGLLGAGTPIYQFNYVRQRNQEVRSDTGYGKVALVYSNDQPTDPANPSVLLPLPQKAAYQVYLQSDPAGGDVWNALPNQGPQPKTEVQIWRAVYKTNNPRRVVTYAVNIAAQSAVGATLDVCSGVIDEGGSAFLATSDRLQSLTASSINVGSATETFDLRPAGALSGCYFTGIVSNGVLQPNAALICAGGQRFSCSFPANVNPGPIKCSSTPDSAFLRAYLLGAVCYI